MARRQFRQDLLPTHWEPQKNARNLYSKRRKEIRERAHGKKEGEKNES
jgi:hypothetical protein